MVSRIVILLSLISFATGFSYGKRCLLHKGQCVTFCPRNMHPYHTRCDKNTLSQRTCSDPYRYVIGYTCGWSRCDCNGEQVLDERQGYCVKLEECLLPDVRSRRGDNPKKPFKLGEKKKMRMYEDDDWIVSKKK